MDSPDAPGGRGLTPPPPPSRRGDSPRRWSPDAALIAGIATLLLAVGVGFLVGRTDHDGSPSASHETITIEDGGEAPAIPPEGGPGGRGHEGDLQHRESLGAPAAPKKSPRKGEGSKQEEREAEQKTKEALHAKVPLAKPKAKLGESCKKGTAGCGKDGKWNGVFFGGEE